MGRLLILGEEHDKATAHEAIYTMLLNNRNCLFLTEKRGDMLVLRQALEKGERPDETKLIIPSRGNDALQAIFHDLPDAKIYSVDFDGTNALRIINILIKHDGTVDEECFSYLMASKNIDSDVFALLEEDEKKEYKFLTEDNEARIFHYFANNLHMRELRNKNMAENIINFVTENPGRDIVVLCGLMHLCRTFKAVDAPSPSHLPKNETRNSLLDFILEGGIARDKVETYIEDNPTNYSRDLPQDIIAQIIAHHGIPINRFSDGFPDLAPPPPEEDLEGEEAEILNRLGL